MAWSDPTELLAAHAAGDPDRARRAIVGMTDALIAAFGAGDPGAIAAVEDGELRDLQTAEAMAVLEAGDVGDDPVRAVRFVRHRLDCDARRARAPMSCTAPRSRTKPRPRGRRERHVARATSSASSGDSSGEPGEPPLARPSRAFLRALAVCPLCGDEEIVRARCWLCGGLGYIARELRNRWKRGWRP